MAITKTKNWADAEGVNYDDMNANFDTLYNKFNTGLVNEDINSSAGITESKLAFNTSSGHDHDGVNSKAIPKAFVFPVAGTLTVSTNSSSILIAPSGQTIRKAYAYVDTAPTGADLIIDIDVSTDSGSTWTSIWNTTQANRLTVSAGSKYSTQTSFDTTSLSEGDLLRINIDQVGSTVSGETLTVELKA